MRRRDREVTEIGEICAILDACKTCYVGMVDGVEPYVVPLSYGYTMENGVLTLYFHSAVEGRKMDIWKRERAVCFTVGMEGALRAAPSPCGYGYAYSSVMGRGMVEFIEDTAGKCRALEILFRHQTGEAAAFTAQQAETVCVYKIVCRDFTAKRMR
ncbi:MAG: pyridoxamine 5'-phosphate oxidase family protein [Clostridiales bacterium]|nr:pyridoxamine 5'-phosphate oxidase family protein [Clostridiales bacterium]